MGKRYSHYLQTILVLLLGSILGLLSFRLLNLIYNVQGTSFIDEIFHVPQAKLYCQNRWAEWNPKITTFPGLYIVSYFILKPLEFFGKNKFCSLFSLRFTNLIATVLNFFLVFLICSSLEQKYSSRFNALYKILTSFNIAIFPPTYFFTFLYYTDVWSTTFVLLMYYLHLSSGKLSKVLGGFAGFMAVLMRQTNIIWVGLMILDDIWSVITQNNRKTVQNYKYCKKVLKKFLSEYLRNCGYKKTFNLMRSIIKKSAHNFIICIGFITFVIYNKSIVVGDKDAHSATFHPMQNLYFLDFVAFFGCPFLILEVISFWKKPPNMFLILLLIGICAGLSESNKLEHPYLLADNRHLAFYIWKRIFGHPIIRRVVVTSYVLSGCLLFKAVQTQYHFMFMVMLIFCTVLNLTPQYLFELRYFIIPFIMFRLHFKQSSAVILETLFFIAINSGVIYLFLNKPFTWASEPNVLQRFIW